MQTEAMTLKFLYQGIELPTAPDETDPQAVRDKLAATFYPELGNAEIRGPKVVGDTLTYEFVRAVGAKG